MMNKTTLVLLIFIAFCSCQPEHKEVLNKRETISNKEMLQDLAIFKSIFEQANAGIYKYKTKKQVDSIFNISKTKIDSPLTYREFYSIIWDIIDFTGSCHNNLSFSDSLKTKIKQQKGFFPFPVKVVENKLRINLQLDDIPLGSEIISINDIKANKIIREVTHYTSTDGTNISGKIAFAATSIFPFNYYLRYGYSDDFIIEYRDINTDKILKNKYQSITYKEFLNNYKQKHSGYNNQVNERGYHFETIDSLDIARISVRTFAFGGIGDSIQKQYVSFLDSSFTVLQEKKYKNLIVDVRDNGGGSDPNDLLLYSYLTRRNFRENISAYTLFNKVPLPQYYVKEYDEEILDLEEELKEEHAILKDHKYYQIPTFNKEWRPNPLYFEGKIYLLIDEFVASAGSLFASMIKSDPHTTVIGVESAGGYYGHTGHIPVRYQLPNSQLVLDFSIVNVDQDVNQLEDQNPADGVKPDIEINLSTKDFILNKDTQLNFVIDQIIQSKRQKQSQKQYNDK